MTAQDLTFGQFNPGGAAQTADIVPIERGGLNYRLTVSAISAFVNANLSAVKSLSNGTDTLSGAVQLIAGTNITIAKTAANTFMFSSTGGGGGGNVDSVNGKTGTVSLNTDDIPEGSTNRYLNQAALDAKFDKTGGTVSGDIVVKRYDKSRKVNLSIENTDATDSSSDAQLRVTTAAPQSGNAYSTYTTYSVADWSVGFNNQIKKFEIAKSDVLGTETALTIDENKNIDVPAGTISVSRGPALDNEVATKLYVDTVGAKAMEAEYQISLDANTYLTKMYKVIVVTATANNFNLYLPSMDVIRQTMSKGESIRIVNLDFQNTGYAFNLCYHDGTEIVSMDSNRGYELLLTDSSTEGNGFFPIPNLLFLFSPDRGPISGLMTLRPDDLEDLPEGIMHLVPGGGNTGDVLQSQGSNQLPVWVPSAIPPAVINTFTPTLVDQEFDLINPKGFYTVTGKKVFIHMTFEFPANQDEDATVIGGIPAVPNSTMPPQIGACSAVSPTLTSFTSVFKVVNGTSTGTIILGGYQSKNKQLSGAQITVTMEYLTD